MIPVTTKSQQLSASVLGVVFDLDFWPFRLKITLAVIDIDRRYSSWCRSDFVDSGWLFIDFLLLFCLRFTHLLTFDPQVNSVKNNVYREWRPTSRKKRSVIAPEVDYVALQTGRRRRAAQLVPRTRVKRSDQLNGGAGTRFDVGVAYQPGAGIRRAFFHEDGRN